MPLKHVVKLIAALNSNQRPGEIAAGVAFGLLLAFQPGVNLLWIAVFTITFFIKLNLAAQFLSLAIFSILTPALDFLLDPLGALVLGLPALHGFFTTLYNLPIVPYTRFNNSLVMGGFVAGILLWLPAYLTARSLVGLYRESLGPAIAGHPAVKAILKLPLVSSLAKLIDRLKRLTAAVSGG